MDQPKVEVYPLGDLPLLYEILSRLGVSTLLDRHYPTHGNRKNGVSFGQTLMIWLLYILTESDHRLSYVEDWVSAHESTLRHLSGNARLKAAQFSDDYLGSVLSQLSDDERWEGFELSQNAHMFEVYELCSQGESSLETLRVDSCNLPSFRRAEGLFQYGYSKHRRSDFPQMKQMLCSLDLGGLPLCGHAFSGQRTDDCQYIPTLKLAQKQLPFSGALYVGDTKMGTIENRNYLAASGDYYLIPLSEKYYPKSVILQALPKFLANDPAVTLLYEPSEEEASQATSPETKVLAKVYELPSNTLSYSDEQGQLHPYQERWIMGQSMHRAEQLAIQLERRLTKAQTQISQRFVITRGRTTLDQCSEAEAFIEQVFKKYKLPPNLLDYHLENSPIKRGKKYPVICTLKRNEEAIEQHKQALGIRIYASNAPKEKLPTKKIIPIYRAQYKIEQNFHHLLNKVTQLLPIYLHKQDRIVGLIRLLSLALKVYHLIQFELRKNLLLEEEPMLNNLIPGQKGANVKQPTTKRVLAAFKQIKAVKITLKQQTYAQIDQLNHTQKRILKLLKIPPDIYQKLGENLNLKQQE